MLVLCFSPPYKHLLHVCYCDMQHIFRESKQWESLLNLAPKQVAEELTKVVSHQPTLALYLVLFLHNVIYVQYMCIIYMYIQYMYNVCYYTSNIMHACVGFLDHLRLIFRSFQLFFCVSSPATTTLAIPPSFHLPLLPPSIPLSLTPISPSLPFTHQDSEVFCSIDSSEYIADLWRNPNHLAKEHLQRFEGVSTHRYIQSCRRVHN